MADVALESPEARSSIERRRRREVRRNWLLCTPALFVLFCAASGPLLIVLVYSFLEAGEYTGVVWQLSGEAWTSVVLQRDIFDGTISIADAHVSILWRSIRLAFLTTLITLVFGFDSAIQFTLGGGQTLLAFDGFGSGELRHRVLELQDHPLRRLLADAGDPYQAGDVAARERREQVLGRHSGEDHLGQPRADPVDAKNREESTYSCGWRIAA